MPEQGPIRNLIQSFRRLNISKGAIIFCTVFLLTLFCAPASNAADSEDPSFIRQRAHMVAYQIEARGINDKSVLEAMRKVQRHKFVPLALRAFAYSDSALPIGDGQTISQPYIVALMTSALNLKGDEKVLEIGTGSGYQCAVLAEIVKEVYSIEIIPDLAKGAEKRLKNSGYTNVSIKVGDGYLGWHEHGPFDAIIVTCAPDKIPERLVGQLKEGGRMVLPLADAYPQRLIKIEKRRGKIVQEYITGVMFVPMVHGEQD